MGLAVEFVPADRWPPGLAAQGRPGGRGLYIPMGAGAPLGQLLRRRRAKASGARPNLRAPARRVS